TMIVPCAGGSNDQVTARHRALLSFDGGVASTTFQHETAGIGSMTMYRCSFAGVVDGTTQVQGIGGVMLMAGPRIRHDDDATISVFERDVFTDLGHQGLLDVPAPQVRYEPFLQLRALDLANDLP